MPQKILSPSDGTTASDYFTVTDTDDLVMAMAGTTGTVHAEMSFGTHDVFVNGSSITGDGTTSLDLVPDGASLRVNPNGNSAHVWLYGNQHGR